MRKGDRVTKLGTDLRDWSGIEAGLFYMRPQVLDYFSQVAKTKEYFTVAQVLSQFAESEMLEAHLVDGRSWFGLETPDAVLTCPDFDFESKAKLLTGRSTSFMNLARLGNLNSQTEVPTNLVLGFSTGNNEICVIQQQAMKKELIGGFVIGVETTTEEDEENRLSSPSLGPVMHDMESDFVLAPGQEPDNEHGCLVDAQEATISKMVSTDRSLSNDAFLVSIPTVAGGNMEQVDGTLGYLIDLPPGGENTYMMAIPESMPSESEERPSSSQFHRYTKLPTDVTKASVQYVEENERGDSILQVSVSRAVPIIGYVLLGIAYFAISSAGPAIEKQSDAISWSMKMFWRSTVSGFGFGLIGSLKYIWLEAELPTYKMLGPLSMTCMGYLFYGASFQLAVTMTSVTNATLFGNVPSCFIVLKKLFMREQIALLEGLGALIALVGALLVGHPWSQAEGASAGVQPTLTGDLVALVGSVGGAFYLENGKVVRAKVDLFILLSIMMVFNGFIMLGVTCLRQWPLITFYDPANTENSLVGWAYPTLGCLYSQLYLSGIVDVMGTLGYIASMKYFDPLIISVVMLAEPIMATAQGIVVGVASIPDAYGIIGSFIVILGATLVVKSSASHEDKVESNIAKATWESPTLDAAKGPGSFNSPMPPQKLQF